MFKKRFITTFSFLLASTAIAAPSGKGHTHTADSGLCEHSKEEFFTGHIHTINHFDFNENNQKVAKTHTHADFMLNFTDKIGVFVGLKLEQDHSHGHEEHGGGGHDDEDTDNKYFEDHVLYIDQLYLDLVLVEDLSLQAGKMRIPLGFGLHEYPGYYGYEVQEELMLLEKIAFNLKYAMNLDNGSVLTLDASTFFSDTTLNESAINDRDGGDIDHKDGGPANTEDFSSYALGFRLDNLYFMSDEYIHEFVVLGGYALQAEADYSDEHGDDEERFVLGGKYIFHYDENIRMSLMNEVVDISSVGAESEYDMTAINWGAQFTYYNWRVGGTYTDYLQDHEEADEEHNGRHVQVSAGYYFDFGLGVEVGYQKLKEVGEEDDSEGPGISLSYVYEF
ncbi:hypothetical protein PQO03_19640 [Lentisphaera profundi]|uniref:Porin domain-containing protein n=1 Tax=Lentisphaera profundi TaxID=1658616 RepID=A0ABY7VYU5_9BACT|nr:hypothetical protein [Lentisphaera profundi]WDE98037.1 hypothetical protein PQO03_19640 [Lentisphaera profundi]